MKPLKPSIYTWSQKPATKVRKDKQEKYHRRKVSRLWAYASSLGEVGDVPDDDLYGWHELCGGDY
jgi:hypothetical protein